MLATNILANKVSLRPPFTSSVLSVHHMPIYGRTELGCAVRIYPFISQKFVSNFWSINKIETGYPAVRITHTHGQTQTLHYDGISVFRCLISPFIKLNACRWRRQRDALPVRSSVTPPCYTHIKIWLSVIPYNPIYFRNFNPNNNKHNVCVWPIAFHNMPPFDPPSFPPAIQNSKWD